MASRLFETVRMERVPARLPVHRKLTVHYLSCTVNNYVRTVRMDRVPARCTDS